MKKRKGFLMIWAIAAVAMAFMLGAAAFGVLSTVLHREQAMEIHLDEVLLAQDGMEREKYNLRFQGQETALPSEVFRNGRSYEVHITHRPKNIEGVPMMEVACRVSHESGASVELIQMVEQGP